MLQTAGRVMTIPKGARMRGIGSLDIIQTFEKHGYIVKQLSLCNKVKSEL